ncbi:hypothetical protein P8452_55198 [Trifolium repens]|nr:hypothetical protein P8452_55198 [Trifolium repens]
MSIMYLTQIKSWFQTKLQDSPQVSENELVSPQGPQCKEGKCSHSTRNVYHRACGLEASSMIHDVKP